MFFLYRPPPISLTEPSPLSILTEPPPSFSSFFTISRSGSKGLFSFFQSNPLRLTESSRLSLSSFMASLQSEHVRVRRTDPVTEKPPSPSQLTSRFSTSGSPFSKVGNLLQFGHGVAILS